MFPGEHGLGLSRAALTRVLGKDRSTLHCAKGVDPASNTDKLALLLIWFFPASRCSTATTASSCFTGFTPPSATPVACQPNPKFPAGYGAAVGAAAGNQQT